MSKFSRLTIFLLAMGVVGGFLPNHAQALTISPVRSELSADPGAAIAGEIRLYNDEPISKTLYSSFENFEASDDGTMPVFTGGTTDLSTWLSAPASVTLEPEQRATISYVVTVPNDATPGGYFAAILWSDEPPNPDQSSQVSVSAKVGTLLLFSVNGDIPSSSSSSGLRTRTKIFSTLPVEIENPVVNDGRDRVIPDGQVTIYDIFGNEVVSIPVNPERSNVLPSSSRSFTVIWSDGNGVAPSGVLSKILEEVTNPKIGKFTAVLESADGTTHKTSFYLFPWHLFLLLLLLILLYVAYRKIRRATQKPKKSGVRHHHE